MIVSTLIFLFLLTALNLFFLKQHEDTMKIHSERIRYSEDMLNDLAIDVSNLNSLAEELSEKWKTVSVFMEAQNKLYSGLRIDLLNLIKQHDELKREHEEEVATNDTSLKHIEDQVAFLYEMEDRIRKAEEIFIYMTREDKSFAEFKDMVRERFHERTVDGVHEGEAQDVASGVEGGGVAEQQDPSDLQKGSVEDRS